MGKFLRTLSVVVLLLFSLSSSAQITIGAVDAGPYGYGSNITVPINIPETECLPRLNNKFELYLSDAAGLFTTETKIGEYSGFYTYFINGVIPSAAPLLPAGDGYRLRVKITGTGAIINYPGTISIRAVNMPAIGVTPSSSDQVLGPDTYGFCGFAVSDNQQMTLINNSAPTTNVGLDITNRASGTSQQYTPGPAGFQVTNIVNSYFTAVLNGTQTFGAEVIKSNKTYLLLNTSLRANIQSTGDGFGCIDPSAGNVATIGYSVNLSGQNGIRNNYPGSIYRIGWGDGSADDIYTHCELIALNGTFSHNFSTTSCGQPPINLGNGNQITNSFSVSVTALNPFCSESNTANAFAKVFIRPIAKINASLPTACTGVPVTFSNGSIAGNNANCSTTMQYEWYVDNQLIATTINFTYAFPTHGNHIVKLIAKNNVVGACPPSEDSWNICIQDPPLPSFTLPGASPLALCAPGVVTPVNTSVVDEICNTNTSYLWTVTGGPVTYDTGSATDRAPTFRFSNPGIYSIKLSVTTASCGVVTTPEQTVIINGPPTVNLSVDANLCNIGAYDFNDQTQGPTRTVFGGTVEETTGTYLWTITGGNVIYESGTSATSRFPKINFLDYAVYTITVSHTNVCGTSSDTQQITFTPSPIISAGQDQRICFKDPSANITATIDVPSQVTSHQWIGNGAFGNANALATTYTPTDAERAAGFAILTFRAVTVVAAPCDVINDEVTIIIKPEIKVTSPSAVTICTGSATDYQPTSNLDNTPNITTYTYTATGSANAGGFNTSGSTFPIADILTNSDPLNNATVTYIITPVNDGCTGDTFTLTVTVTPLPIVTPSLTNSAICSGNPAGINLSSNLSGVTYTWTSTITGNITGAGTQVTPTADLVINDVLFNTGTTPGNVTYYITPISLTGCPGTTVPVTVRVDPPVTIANAGPDDSICNLDTYTLQGNPAFVGTGTWTLISGQSGVTFGNINLETTPVSGLQPGNTYVFSWTISAPGTCTTPPDNVSITVNMPTVAGTASGDATVCEGNNTGMVTLTGNVGTILRWESSVNNGANWQPTGITSTSISYNNLSVSTQYRAVVQNGSCNIMVSNAVSITVTPATTVATAGPSRGLCNETSIVLQGNTPGNAGETGLWTMVNGGTPNTLITAPSNPTTTVTGLTPGVSYTFRWTITGVSPCGPSFAVVTYNNLPALTNTISSPNIQVCYGQVITINGVQPTGGNGTYAYSWESSPDGANWTVINGQTGKDLTYTLLSTLKFRRTVISGACIQLSNVITIIAQPPISNNILGADQELCSGIVPALLTGSQPTGADGTGNFNYQWQSSTDGTTWTNINSAVFPTYAPPALTVTTMYRRVVSTITCSGDLANTSLPVTITVKPDAKAEFTYSTDRGCAPFLITAQNIHTVPYADRNGTYTWFANNVQIGTGINFPGYTITNSNELVDIKLVVTSSLGCSQAEFTHTFGTIQNVIPAFSQSTAEGCGPLIVNFVNTSASLVNATFKWDFGNGTTSSQVMPGPVTFLPDPTGKDITYTVTLTATNACGVNSITSTVFVKAKPIAVFSPSKTVGCSPMTVTFTNTSPGGTNTYYYDFGDGTSLTKTDKSDVQHTFTTGAVTDFVVKMRAVNECGTDESSYTIRVSPNTVLPELVVNANEREGCAPFKVNFYNNSKGANSFKYTFGDGSTVLTHTAPEVVAHTFTTPGTYTVTLLASNGCSDTTTTETITVLPQPLTSFNADITLGCPGLVVQFRNTTTDGVAYLWDFGDGTTSTEFEPKHTFTGAQEYYTVSLTATNNLGCNYTATLNQYIHIVPPPVAKFNVNPSTLISIPNYTFKFEDESTNNPTIWLWDFGDGTTSVLQSPSHTYPDTGSYIVNLRVTNQQGCFTTTFKKVTIVGVPGYLYVPNSFIPGSAFPELREFRAKGSGIKSWKMSVFNKWGQVLWETTKLEEGRPMEGWDGVFQATPVPQGVYFWKIDVEFINGSAWKGMTYDSSPPKKTGPIHLIR